MQARRFRQLAAGLSAAAALCAACIASAANGADAPVALETREVAPGVFVHEGKVRSWGSDGNEDVANLAFIVGSRCVAVIDSGGSPRVGEALRAAIERRTRLPVCYLINTHVHPDHVLGNSAFATLQPRPQFIGHARLAPALGARAPFYLATLERELGTVASTAWIVPPDRAVDGSAELDLGDRILQLRAWPTAHTDNDLSVLDVRTRTLLTGDLLFSSHLPVIDGKLLGWLQVSAELAKTDAARVVPGHGAVSTDWPAVLEPQTRYLGALRDQVRAAIQAGDTITQTVDRLSADAVEHWQLVDEFHRRNITAAYAELEWE